MLAPRKRIAHIAGSDDLTAGSDDLTLVRGIGETTAARLKEAGVSTFQRLSQTTPGELSALLGGAVRRSPARIAAERWTSQAAALAADARGPGDERATKDEGRTRHSFTLTLLIDVRSRHVVASKLVDCQTNDSATIPGWDVEALIAYVRERAGLDTSGEGTPTAPALPGAKAAPASPPSDAGAGISYPFARGMKSLTDTRPGAVPHAIRVNVDTMRLSPALPDDSYAVIEFHASTQRAGPARLNRTTVNLRAAEPAEIVIPVYPSPGAGSVAGMVTLWVMAPGLRPALRGAAIPFLEIEAEFLYNDPASP